MTTVSEFCNVVINTIYPVLNSIRNTLQENSVKETFFMDLESKSNITFGFITQQIRVINDLAALWKVESLNEFFVKLSKFNSFEKIIKLECNKNYYPERFYVLFSLVVKLGYIKIADVRKSYPKDFERIVSNTRKFLC